MFDNLIFTVFPIVLFHLSLAHYVYRHISNAFYRVKQSTTFKLIVPTSPELTIEIAVISASCGDAAAICKTLTSPKSVVI